MSTRAKTAIAAVTTILFLAGLSAAGLAMRADEPPPATAPTTQPAQPADEGVVPAAPPQAASLDYEEDETGEGEYGEDESGGEEGELE